MRNILQAGAPCEAEAPSPCGPDGFLGGTEVITDKVGGGLWFVLSQGRRFGFSLWEEADSEIPPQHGLWDSSFLKEGDL